MTDSVFTLEEFYASLPAYQADSIKSLVELHGEVKTAELWLNTHGPSQSSQFGGERKNENYFARLKHQIDLLVCGGKDYEEERKEYITIGKTLNVAAVGLIVAKLAPIVGLAPALLTAPAGLLLHSICKVGIKAYCVNINITELEEQN